MPKTSTLNTCLGELLRAPAAAAPDAPPAEPEVEPRTPEAPPRETPELDPFEPSWPPGRTEPQPKAQCV
jgi:hypothetical protein